MNAQIRLIAAREFRERVRARAFIISTAIMVVGLVAFVAITSIVSSTTTHFDVAVSGDAAALAPRMATIAPALDVTLTIYPDGSSAQDTADLKSGHLDAVVSGSAEHPTVTFSSQPDATLTELVSTASTQTALIQRFVAAGLSPDAAARAVVVAPPVVQSVTAIDRAAQTRSAAAFLGDLLLYMSIVLVGVAIGGAVVSEKSGRIVELLLAAVSARDLLVGKVIGIGAVAILQFAGFLLAGLGTALVVGSAHIPVSTLGVIPHILLWFILGFALYAILFAAAGAAVNRFEDLQSATMPLTVFQLAGYLIGITATGSPNAPLVRIAEFVPFTAPMVVLARVGVDAAAPWEEPVVAVIVIITTVIAARVGARIYKAGLLDSSGGGLRHVLDLARRGIR